MSKETIQTTSRSRAITMSTLHINVVAPDKSDTCRFPLLQIYILLRMYAIDMSNFHKNFLTSPNMHETEIPLCNFFSRMIFFTKNNGRCKQAAGSKLEVHGPISADTPQTSVNRVYISAVWKLQWGIGPFILSALQYQK